MWGNKAYYNTLDWGLSLLNVKKRLSLLSVFYFNYDLIFFVNEPQQAKSSKEINKLESLDIASLSIFKFIKISIKMEILPLFIFKNFRNNLMKDDI